MECFGQMGLRRMNIKKSILQTTLMIDLNFCFLTMTNDFGREYEYVRRKSVDKVFDYYWREMKDEYAVDIWRFFAGNSILIYDQCDQNQVLSGHSTKNFCRVFDINQIRLSIFEDNHSERKTLYFAVFFSRLKFVSMNFCVVMNIWWQ